MKPLIGIWERSIIEDTKKVGVNKEIIEAIINNGGNVIGIFNYEMIPNELLEEQLNLLDGIILPGGSDINQYDDNIMKLIFKRKIPCLGICLGMQQMISYFDKKSIVKIKNNCINHYSDKFPAFHEIEIMPNTYMSGIYFSKKIIVNSYHQYMVTNIPNQFRISAISKLDNVIEAIELNDENHFMLGVQFHPERDYVINEAFKRFLQVCQK